ncbi:hypothetical protein IQ283_14425 [Alkalihalobacillus hwajinpoensis]|nr:hypothetical protein [Pseudalkalibacillus hwajinpoensis]MBF0707790.1 hypothetical protein [Pseudalkalibacillus hwajinpoensis]
MKLNKKQYANQPFASKKSYTNEADLAPSQDEQAGRPAETKSKRKS